VEIMSGMSIIAKVMNLLVHINEKIKGAKLFRSLGIGSYKWRVY